MKALGVALAACCAAVLWPSALHANPICARDAAERTKLATIPGSQAFDGDHDADDGTFTAQAGLDHSIHFATTGTIDVFNDDHTSLGNVIDTEGRSTAESQMVTVGLRTASHAGDNDADDQGPGNQGQGHAYAWGHDHSGPKVSDPPRDPAGGGGTSTSATPEPASMLLLATGLAGVILCRRQLFA
jgi:hypothetical protein